MDKQQAQSDKSLTSNSAAAGSVYIFKSTCRADKHFSKPHIFMLNYTQICQTWHSEQCVNDAHELGNFIPSRFSGASITHGILFKYFI